MARHSMAAKECELFQLKNKNNCLFNKFELKILFLSPCSNKVQVNTEL